MKLHCVKMHFQQKVILNVMSMKSLILAHLSLYAWLEDKIYHCVNSSLYVTNFPVGFSSLGFNKNPGHPQLTDSVAIAIRGHRWC